MIEGILELVYLLMGIYICIACAKRAKKLDWTNTLWRWRFSYMALGTGAGVCQLWPLAKASGMALLTGAQPGVATLLVFGCVAYWLWLSRKDWAGHCQPESTTIRNKHAEDQLREAKEAALKEFEGRV